tara:strand:- start:1232 stop:2809 length:1578 start_codon:yes stop_codon:yes gene_type:complete
VLRSHERALDHHALASLERARREDASTSASTFARARDGDVARRHRAVRRARATPRDRASPVFVHRRARVRAHRLHASTRVAECDARHTARRDAKDWAKVDGGVRRTATRVRAFDASEEDRARRDADGEARSNARAMTTTTTNHAPSPSTQEVKKFTQICAKCARHTAIVEDHASGDLICTECGLVIESRIIDECSEWRTFGDGDKDRGGADPSRTVGATNVMLTGGGLSTTIGKNPDGTYNATLTRLHNRGMNPDKALISAFHSIGEFADAMGMNRVVRDGACDLYRMVTSAHSTLGKSNVAMYAACLYIAARQEGMTRTFKEVCGAAQGTTVKEIGRCYKFILKVCDGLNMQMNEQMITPELLTNRFCGNLGMSDHDFLKLCSHIVRTFRELRDSEGHKSEKQPASVAAAAIFIASVVREMHKDKASLFRISEVSGMAEVTIRTSFFDMVPYASRLLPSAHQGKLADLLTEAEKMREGSTMALPSHATRQSFHPAPQPAVPLLKLELDGPIEVPGDVLIKEELK